MAWTAFIDGGSRGNPGAAAAGVVLRDPAGKIFFAGGFPLGRLTNNQAEYRGLLLALDLLAKADADKIEIASDSELLVHQVNGVYKVKSPDLRPLVQQATQKLDGFTAWKVRHVRREENTQADKLVNQALDARRKVVLTDTMKLTGDVPEPPVSAPAAPSLFPAETGGPRVEIHVVQGPASGACPAGTRKGQTFAFTTVTPGGMCVDACAAVADAVLGLRELDADDASKAEAMTVRCGRPGCGAAFEIRLVSGK